MSIRRTLTSVAAATAVGVGTLVFVAPSASAADLGTVNVLCGDTTSPFATKSGTVGDTFSIIGSSTDGYTCSQPVSGDTAIVTVATGNIMTQFLTVSLVGEGSVDIEVPTTNGSSPRTITVRVIVAAAPTPTPTPAPSVGGIPAWVQAYGRAGVDATCEEGWAPSWQEWAEPITGGWVCTRTVPALG